MTPHIVFLDAETLPASIDWRAPGFPHRWTSHARTAPHEVAERIRDASIVITNKVRLDAEALARAPKLELIAVAATGTDNIDLSYCQQHGIAVRNVRGYAVHTVPEHALMLMLALRRQLIPYRQALAQGRWQQSQQFCFHDFPIRDLAGDTLGLIGYGSLGQGLARLAQALGMRVLISARIGADTYPPDRTAFSEVLRQSDVISLHLPLTPETRHCIGAPEFAQMAKRPLLINTARGGLVDEQALASALESGQITGAGFDVSQQEPPATDSVLWRLAERQDFLLTPHVAWAGAQATQALADQLHRHLEDFWQQRQAGD
ncbi:MAG: D-2-hydroxyacid dehydrogenase [Pigmentiphaga sp.]|nr:D-2-hydroxyacid dehydrogenase [Pigmentiphaga sp.]